MSKAPQLSPRDAHNAQLLANVHPPDWRNPEPTGRYNLVVVGAGSAGLITAAIASGLGARVALVERHLLGGDCLNVGCVPSKALIRSARRVAETESATQLGLPPVDRERVDFGAAMERVRRVRAQISHEDAASRYQEELGVDVYLGEARFTSRDAVEVDGRALRFKKAVIATGARAAAPALPGLAEAGYLTNETVFELTERPRRLAVIGGGPIGCELAQTFRRLGSQVTILDKAEHVLVREDADAAALVQQAFERDGIRLELGVELVRVEAEDDGKALFFRRPDGASGELRVDEILVGIGRRPNVEDLGLEAAGVVYGARGVQVDDRLRTANPRIFAAGDVCMNWKFTHAADAAAKIVVQNALFLGRKKLSDLIMPWCTYTDPEIAHVGAYERDAERLGVAMQTFSIPLRENNRAVTDGDEEGFVKVYVKRGSDRILGATVVARHAGELISHITQAMVSGTGLGTFVNVIFPYPTQSETIKRVAGAYTRTRLTPLLKKVLERWMAFARA